MRLWEYLDRDERNALVILFGGAAEAVLESDHRLYTVFRDRVIGRLYAQQVPTRGKQRTVEELSREFFTSANNIRHILKRQAGLVQLTRPRDRQFAS